MASLSTENNGNRYIQFADRDRKRKKIRLGKIAKRKAEAIKSHIEQLAIAKMTSTAPPRETGLWLDGVGDVLYDRIAAVGLAKKRESALLGPFLSQYFQRKQGSVKSATIAQQRHAEQSLIEFFGVDKLLHDFNEADAEIFRNWLIGVKGLAEATVRKRCSDARMFFRHATKAGIARSNPFESVPTAPVGTKRHAYISRDDAIKVMDALPNAEWRLLFALARYGGLRVVSEPKAMTWADVDWDRQRLTIHSQKTEHIEGHETRQIPIFPEIAEVLQQVFDEAADGEQYVLPMLQGKTATALRKPFTAAIKRAGLEPWPRMWHNLRSTRQTELEDTFPSHVVCAWIGNSEKVAAKHYLQLRDEYFEEAVQNRVQQPSANGRNEEKQPRSRGTEQHMAASGSIKASPQGFEP